MNEWMALLTIVGLAVITVLCRSFFLIPKTDLPMPDWLRDALRYAPLAALVAIVVPETVLTQGQLIQTWQDPRLFAAAAGLAWYMLRKGILGTIVCGTSVLLVLRLGLGWT